MSPLNDDDRKWLHNEINDHSGCLAVLLFVIFIAQVASCSILKRAQAIEPPNGRPAVGGLSSPGRSGVALKPARRSGPPLPACMAKHPVSLLLFTAEWCAPCKKQLPILRELGFPIYVFDVDKQPEVARHYGVQALPTVIVGIHGGREAEIVGVRTRASWQVRAKVWEVKARRRTR